MDAAKQVATYFIFGYAWFTFVCFELHRKLMSFLRVQRILFDIMLDLVVSCAAPKGNHESFRGRYPGLVSIK